MLNLLLSFQEFFYSLGHDEIAILLRRNFIISLNFSHVWHWNRVGNENYACDWLF